MMKSKLKAQFLPPTYVQDFCSQLHHLNQGNSSVEEYTREFEKLVIKYDLHKPEEQAIVRYLGGLDPRYPNIVDLQAYTSFDEVSSRKIFILEKQVLSHLDFIYPLKLANKRKIYKLPTPTRIYLILGMWFLNLMVV